MRDDDDLPPEGMWGTAVVRTWLERSLLVSRPLRSCSSASFLARISSRFVSSPSRSSSPLLCSSTRSISSSSHRFWSSIFCTETAKTQGVVSWRNASFPSTNEFLLTKYCLFIGFTCCSSNEMTEPLLPLRLCLWKAAISSVFILKIFCCCSFFISSSY